MDTLVRAASWQWEEEFLCWTDVCNSLTRIGSNREITSIQNILFTCLVHMWSLQSTDIKIVDRMQNLLDAAN